MDQAIIKLKNDCKFQSIVDKYESSNILNIIGDTLLERRHTKLICWLLNPKSNHGLGDYPMRCFMNCLNEMLNENIDFESIDISKFEVRSEEHIRTGYPDIVCKCEAFLIVLENKINANESGNQTDRYSEYYEKEYPDIKKLYIYLKPGYSNSKPINSSFQDMNYQQLYDNVIRPCMYYEGCPPETRIVLDQYTIAMSSPKLHRPLFIIIDKELTSDIVNNNKEGFERLKNIVEENMAEASEELNFFVEYGSYLNTVLRVAEEGEISISAPRGEASIVRILQSGFYKIDPHLMFIDGEPSEDLREYFERSSELNIEIRKKTILGKERKISETFVMQLCKCTISDKYGCVVGYKDTSGNTVWYKNDDGFLIVFNTLQNASYNLLMWRLKEKHEDICEYIKNNNARVLYDEVDTAAPGYRKWTIIRAAKEECEGKKLKILM